INNAIATRTGSFAGYGFAVPITLARQVLDDFLQYGRIRRAVLGVQISEVFPADAGAAGLDRIGGAKVDQFSADDSPARRAGIQTSEVSPADAGAAGRDRIGGAKVDQFSADDSPARRAGIQIGDIITAIDGREIARVSTLQRVVRAKSPGETVEVTVSRFGEE